VIDVSDNGNISDIFSCLYHFSPYYCMLIYCLLL